MSRPVLERIRPALPLLALVVAAAGCDSGPSAPLPPPPSADSPINQPLLPPVPTLARGVTEIDFVLPGKLDPPMKAWEQAARREAGRSGATLELRRGAEGSGGDEQARQVLEAVRRGADAVLIAPGADGSGDLGPALAEAKKLGVPLVTFLVPVQVGDETLPVVIREGYESKARDLVRALVEDARIVGHEPTGPALVLINDLGTDHILRARAMTEALAEAGVAILGGEPRHFVNDFDEAKKLIKQATEEHPRLPFVITLEDVGYRAATSQRNLLPAGDRFLYASFIEDARGLDMVKRSFASAVTQCGHGPIGRIATQLVLASLANDEPLPGRIVIPLPFERAPDAPSQEVLSYEALLGEQPKATDATKP